MRALVAGATGLVGGHLLRLLARDRRYDDVVALVRRPLSADTRAEGVRERVVEWDDLEAHAAGLAADHVFCALGTTMRSAGSRDAFRRVDLDYPRVLARLTRRAGARHFSLVSAVGASPRSRVFYNRVKGEVEEAVREAGFPSGAILRPSVLGGAREERRPLERVGQWVAAVIPGRYRRVDAADVARVMIQVAAEERAGWRVIESEQIRAIAAGRAGAGAEG